MRAIAAFVAAGLAGVLVVAPAAAQTSVRSEVDSRRVGLQDQFRWTVTVEGAALPDQIGRLLRAEGASEVGGADVVE